MLKKAIYILTLALCTAVLLNSRLQAQFGSQRSQQSEQERELEQRRQKEANKKRQEEIRDDTQKLYQLAGELKDAVDKSNEHMLSLDVVKKAEEVEKLAKKVKEKMREGTAKPPELEQRPAPRPPFGAN